MAIEFNCPHCGVLYKLKDELAGKSGKCKNPKCLKPILIPYQSTVGANGPAGVAMPLDAEALAAAAFNDEKPPPEAVKEAPAKQMSVACPACEHKFQVDVAMGGKNTPCPECGKIIRVPKPVEDKPADWRNTAANKPSLAKVSEPVPAGAWDAQRKGVSGEALRKAGALDVEDEEEPGERRLRRIKQACYGVALLGVIAIAVWFVMKNRRDGKQERWMEMAVAEIEDKNEGSKKPEFQAAIQRFSGEYHVRAATKREDLQGALDSFNKARDHLQSLPPDNPDRNAMLVELGVSLVVCGGDSKEIAAEKRLPWDQVHPLIRKCFDKIPADEMELRNRSLRLLSRRLADKDQGQYAAVVARNSSADAEQPEMIGRVGIEFFLMGKKVQAETVLAQTPAGAQPAATALWLGLHPDDNEPPAAAPRVLPPVKGVKDTSLESRLAYAEGRALQGRFDEAQAIARLPGSVGHQIEALNNVAAVALDTGKGAEAVHCIEDISALVKLDPKGLSLSSWSLARSAELAARAGKMEAVQALLDAIKVDAVRSWARLDVLRIKLAGQQKQKGDETWLEPIAQPDQATLAPALAQEEIARHNAAAGETSYARIVEGLPKGTIRPFGYAGTALGAQDRNAK